MKLELDIQANDPAVRDFLTVSFLNDVNSSRGAINQGRTRLDRANNYFNVMIDIADKENIPLRWTYKVVDRVGHDYKKMTFQAAKILLQDVKSFD